MTGRTGSCACRSRSSFDPSAARAFLALPDTQQKFFAQSLDASPSAPASFQRFMREELQKFTTLVERANIRVE